jgi:hypothetical protein
VTSCPVRSPRRLRLEAGEIYETALDIGVDKFDANMISHFESLKTERKSAFSWRLKEPNPSAFVRRAGDDGVELLSNLSR